MARQILGLRVFPITVFRIVNMIVVIYWFEKLSNPHAIWLSFLFEICGLFYIFEPSYDFITQVRSTNKNDKN